MKNSTYEKKVIFKKLPIAFCYLAGASSFVFGQNSLEIQSLQKQTNVKTLKVLKKVIAQRTLSLAALRKKASQLNIPFSGTTDHGNGAFQLMGFDRNNLPLYYKTFNSGAAETTGTEQLNDPNGIFNLEGEGITIYEWDGGSVLTSHQEFTGRAKQIDDPNGLSGHSTHVGGTLIAKGINPNAKGMAPKALLNAYDWIDDSQEMMEASDKALVSNHSYGFTGGFDYGNYSGETGWHWLGNDEDTEFTGYGIYSNEDALWDLISLYSPYYLPVKAAGNPRGSGPNEGEYYFVRGIKDDGTYGWKKSTKKRQKNGGEKGFDCINRGATEKNSLIVGAAYKIPGGYEKPSDVKAASFSAFGPTDDGRIKPDIAGIGVDVFSTNSSGNSDYYTLSGTSMATPNVTGSISLLQEYYKKLGYGTTEHPFMKSATLKGLITHTANEAGDAPGPDYKFGWGLLNALKAAQTLALKDKYSFVKEETLDNNQNYTLAVKALGTEPLKITISWDDPVLEKIPNENFVLNNRTPVLVNDLDLRISDGDSSYLPWILDPVTPEKAAQKGDNKVDNIEQVVIENPLPGKTYKITVSHKGQLKQNEIVNGERKLTNAKSQNFSLIATGISNGVEKDLELKSITLPSVLEYTEKTPVSFKINNLGDKNFSTGKLKYQLINNDSKTVEKEEIVSLGTINSGQFLDKIIELDLSKSFVNYTIKAEIVSDEDKIVANNSQSIQTFGIVADLRKIDSKHFFGFEENFDKYGWTSEDVDKNGRTWMKYNESRLAKTGKSFATNFANKQKGSNDWLFSNPLKLKKNRTYKVIFNIGKIYDYNEYLKVGFGEHPNSASMNPIGTKISATTNYVRYSFDFTPEKDGIFYIGFNNETPASEISYAIFLDDVTIVHTDVKPIVDFSASKTNVNSFETVSLKDESESASSMPITQYEWSFFPENVTFVEGNKNSKNPKVIFNQEGEYTITLKAKNSEGESSETKTSYIQVKNTKTVADFKANKTNIYETQKVTFSDTSTGNPKAEKWKWTITPSDGVEFSNGNTEQNPTVTFNKAGKYSVSLEASSPYNSDINTKKEYINVVSVHNKVLNLKGQYDEKTSNGHISWNRPYALPFYSEDFENFTLNGEYTPIINEYGMSGISGDRDGQNWYTFGLFTHNGSKSAVSFSFDVNTTQPKDVDHWLITDKINKNAEYLNFWMYPIGNKKERMEVYIVPANIPVNQLTIDLIKSSGHKLYDDENISIQTRGFIEKNFDISKYTNTDSYIVFHHKAKAEDDSAGIILDDIEVGLNNDKKNNQDKYDTKKSIQISPFDIKNLVKEQKDKIILSNNKTTKITPVKSIHSDELTKLVGYQVVRDGKVVENIDDINKLYHDEIFNNSGIYTFDVYAVYSDGIKSEKESVTLDTRRINDNGKGFNIYPNPSEGIFSIETKSNIDSLDVEIYDASGRLILNHRYNSNRADINLTKYPKGVYIVKVTNNNNETETSKIIIK